MAKFISLYLEDQSMSWECVLWTVDKQEKNQRNLWSVGGKLWCGGCLRQTRDSGSTWTGIHLLVAVTIAGGRMGTGRYRSKEKKGAFGGGGRLGNCQVLKWSGTVLTPGWWWDKDRGPSHDLLVWLTGSGVRRGTGGRLLVWLSGPGVRGGTGGRLLVWLSGSGERKGTGGRLLVWAVFLHRHRSSWYILAEWVTTYVWPYLTSAFGDLETP